MALGDRLLDDVDCCDCTCSGAVGSKEFFCVVPKYSLHIIRTSSQLKLSQSMTQKVKNMNLSFVVLFNCFNF